MQTIKHIRQKYPHNSTSACYDSSQRENLHNLPNTRTGKQTKKKYYQYPIFIPFNVINTNLSKPAVD